MSYNYNTEPRGGFGIYDDRCCGRENKGGMELAVSSVPVQLWRMTYSPDKALQAGTMFAELNLPFLGGKRK